MSSATADRSITLALPRTTSADGIEAMINEIRGQCELLRIDLLQYRHTRIFAESRLLGMLARVKSQGTRITVRLPISANALLAATGGKYKTLFGSSALGVVLAQFADSIEDSTRQDIRYPILTAQFNELSRSSGFLSSGGHMASAIFLDAPIGSPRSADVFWRSDDVAAFRTILRSRVLEPIGVDNFVHLGGGTVADLARLVYEAVDNTELHARTDLDGTPLSGVRFVVARRFTGQDEPLKKLSTSSSSPFFTYYKALLDREFPPDFFVELSIADGGVGVAARLAQTMAIYQRSIEEERAIIQEAMMIGRTSRQEREGNAGLGFAEILDRIRRVHGFFAIRTGRSYLSRHYLDDASAIGDTELRATRSAYSLIAGTSLNVIVPFWRSTRKLQRSLDL